MATRTIGIVLDGATGRLGTTQHLKALREAKLVRVEKRAQQRIYRINPDAMREVEQWARKVREMWEVWDERFDALDQVLAAEKQKTSAESEHASHSQEGNDG